MKGHQSFLKLIIQGSQSPKIALNTSKMPHIKLKLNIMKAAMFHICSVFTSNTNYDTTVWFECTERLKSQKFPCGTIVLLTGCTLHTA